MQAMVCHTVTGLIHCATLYIYRCGACPNIISSDFTAIEWRRLHQTQPWLKSGIMQHACIFKFCCLSCYSNHWMIRKHRFLDLMTLQSSCSQGDSFIHIKRRKWWNCLSIFLMIRCHLEWKIYFLCPLLIVWVGKIKFINGYHYNQVQLSQGYILWSNRAEPL